MNLIEAIKSGKPRRLVTSASDAVCKWHTGESILYVAHEVTDEGWEIQEITVAITRTRFWDAVGPFGDSVPFTFIGGRKFVPFDYWPNLREIARKLGLED